MVDENPIKPTKIVVFFLSLLLFVENFKRNPKPNDLCSAGDESYDHKSRHVQPLVWNVEQYLFRYIEV